MLDKTTEVKSSQPTKSDSPAGDSISYRIVSQIVAENSVLLYRAIREDDGSQIDVLVLGSLDEQERERTKKRISLASQLNHPAVARVIDVHLADEDQSCILEPISKRSLSDVADQRVHQDAIQLLSYGHQIASAVAAGHRIGLVHGKISPDTIHVRGDGSLQIDYLRPSSDEQTATGKTAKSQFQAPELGGRSDPDAAADVYSLASLLMWLFAGDKAGPVDSPAEIRERLIQNLPTSDLDLADLDAFCEAIGEALAADPADRATADELCARLERLARNILPAPLNPLARHSGTQSDRLDETGALDFSLDQRRVDKPQSGVQKPRLIGRFQILDKLGEGGMGEVFKAKDTSDGTLVAVKILSRRIMNNRQAVRRFQKEARLLGEIKSPYVTNLVEVNQDNGQHYIVMDYVAGVDLRKMIRTSAPFSERVALSVMADVARGLVSAHEREIVHRDIKPGNILLAYDSQDTGVDVKSARLDASSLQQFRVKLSDFGLAREVDQSESMQMTREGSSVGTPMYMAPEQFSGGQVSPATDVYSMGITLYEMLAGKPPFSAPDISQLINSHCRESPAALQAVDGEISEATCEIVQRAIAKQPQERYSDAGQFLSDIERVLRGEASNVDAHPQVPTCQPGDIFEEVFEWQLEGEAADLWPYVSNTERINNAVGVPSVTYDVRRDDQGRLRKYGAFRMAGLQIGWEEHPFEWIEGQRLGILREFQQGPFVWFLSVVELIPQIDGGTRLRHSVRILPRGLVGRLVAKLEVSVKGRRNLERVYRRIDHAVRGALGNRVDPFSQSAKLSAARRRLLDERLDQLADLGTDPEIVECLGHLLRESPAQELSRIRPIALARTSSVDPDRMIAGCLAAAKVGLLDLHWDILCPTCRIPSQVSSTLKEIENHARCEVCDLDFEVDLAQSVEMIFRANPEVREADLGTYCIGGPEHSPHVVLQLRLPAGERVELTPVLSEGAYVLRSAQLPYNYRLRALPGKGTTHTEIVLSSNLDSAHASQVRAGRNTLTLTNDYDREIVVRLERSILRQDVVTAAQASSLPMFREMFPDESPKLGQLINVSTVTLLAIDLVDADQIYQDLDDTNAFVCVREFHTQLEQLAAKHSGAIVKVMGTEALLAFETRFEIVNLVTELVEKLNQGEHHLQLCAAVHRGTALATSIDDHLDYFGSTVHLVRRIMQQAGAGELWITEAIAADPLVVQTIRDQQLTAEVIDLPRLGPGGMRCQRITFA